MTNTNAISDKTVVARAPRSLQQCLNMLLIEEIMASGQHHEVLMGFCRDVVSGLGHLHNILEIPLDLGARTCQVAAGMTIKVMTKMM